MSYQMWFSVLATVRPYLRMARAYSNVVMPIICHHGTVWHDFHWHSALDFSARHQQSRLCNWPRLLGTWGPKKNHIETTKNGLGPVGTIRCIIFFFSIREVCFFFFKKWWNILKYIISLEIPSPRDRWCVFLIMKVNSNADWWSSLHC